MKRLTKKERYDENGKRRKKFITKKIYQLENGNWIIACYHNGKWWTSVHHYDPSSGTCFANTSDVNVFAKVCPVKQYEYLSSAIRAYNTRRIDNMKIAITITTELLKFHNACEEGIDDFLEVFPEGIVEIPEWESEVQAWILLHPKLRRWWGWLVLKGLFPSFSMAGWNLSGLDLSEADLRGTNLERADLSKAVLRLANLSRVNLNQANLTGANFSKANLAGANLTGANFSKANLAWANLQWANLKGANFCGATLSGANLQWADLEDANFTGSNFSWRIL